MMAIFIIPARGVAARVITKTTLGGVLHVLLVIAIVFLLINDDAPVVVDGRRR